MEPPFLVAGRSWAEIFPSPTGDAVRLTGGDPFSWEGHKGSTRRPALAMQCRAIPKFNQHVEFRALHEPGFALAAMNFALEDDGPGACRVTTETRVHATDARSRRLFATYWRTIYPGSALIRRTWLRAVRLRAEGGE
jgi:hypothetical protein